MAVEKKKAAAPKKQKAQRIVKKTTPGKPEPFSAGSYTVQESDGTITQPGQSAMMLLSKRASMSKQSGLFADGGLGNADIQDSQNIGYYSFEFPVDSLELPQSRKEELKFYRMAYDRDPVVSRAIDLHTELPLSKLILEKPKSSSENFADFIFDFYQGLVNEAKLFDMLLHATREYWLIGEAFIYVDDEADIEPCEAAVESMKNRRGRDQDSEESDFHAAIQVDDLDVMEWMIPSIKSSLEDRTKLKSKIREARKLSFNLNDSLTKIDKEIKSKQSSIKTKIAKIKTASMKLAVDPPVDAGEADKQDSNAKAGDELKSPLEIQKGKEQDRLAETGELLGDTAPVTGEPGGGGDEAPDLSGGMGLAPAPGRPSDIDINDPDAEPTPEDNAETEADKNEIAELKKYLELLEKKKELLLELKEIREKKEHEYELFSHLVNKDYMGWSGVQLIPPDRVEIRRDGRFGAGAVVFYEPSPTQKDAILNDKDVDPNIRDILEQEGKIPLNYDPLKGSFLVHFARKKAPFEDHGRSILQRCLRTIIYRDKLRQVQTTIVSRNMTPKTLIVAPGISSGEVMNLRAHADEAKADPDYTIVVNYEARWDEIGSEGRILALDSEWTHTNADLSTGLGFSPDLLTGEGFYSGNRIHLELLNTTYVLFRETLCSLVEENFFKPIAMRKGFYEEDRYGRPRWIYPKLNFSRLALRDQGDVYDMLYNLYSKGSIPIDIIYDFLNLDAESCRRKLEEDLFTVNDSKFNQLLDAIYGGITEKLIEGTDLVSRVTQGLQLKETPHEEDGLEGSGEGM